MPSITLTDPVSATTVASGLIATNNANLRNLLNGLIDNTNIAPAAAIAASKLAGYPSDVTKFLRGDGTWTTVSSTPGVGSITSSMIADGTIVDVDINAAAAIALTKLATIPVIGQSNAAWRIQQIVSTSGVTGSRALTYPVAFSSTPLVMPAITAGSGGLASDLTSITASGFTFTNGGASGANFYWIAFGPA